MTKKPKHAGGRPTKYKPEFVEQAAKLCELAATDVELADFFEVTVTTLNRWKIEYPEFCASIKEGKEASDARVERSLYQRAVGYTFDAVKIMTVSEGNNQGSRIEEVPYREHVPPDTTAQIFWLKNRKRADWRDKQDIEHSGSMEIVAKEQRDAAIATALRSKT
jgi:hypothetical protein